MVSRPGHDSGNDGTNVMVVNVMSVNVMPINVMVVRGAHEWNCRCKRSKRSRLAFATLVLRLLL